MLVEISPKLSGDCDVPATSPASFAAPSELSQMAFSLCPAAFIVWDTDARIREWNPAAERIFGWTRHAATAQTSPRFLVRKADWPYFESVFRQLFDAKEPTDWLSANVTQDGRMIHCDWHSLPVRDSENRLCGFISIVQDVTSRRQAEAELERVLTQSAQILASISSILIGVDSSNVISTWNSAASDAFGLRTAEALGQPFCECGIQWDWKIVLEGMEKCTTQQQAVRLEDILYVTPGGKERFLGVTLNPISHHSDEPQGFLLLAADITQRRIMEGQLATAQKLESIGHLAAGIAHEINTPIQYVGDNVRFLQETINDLRPLLSLCQASGDREITDAVQEADLEYLLEEIPKATGQALDGVARVTHIVRAMKEFSHPGTAHKVAADLNRALDSTLTVANNEWKYVANLVTDFDPNLPLIPCLPADLNQVFLNMIVNAAHAIGDVVGDGSGGKGTITVSTRFQGDCVEVRISDTGGGMTEEIKARIFDPFFTTKAVGRGTGQGLAISHTVVVEKHGGSIAVETAAGRGTTFIIRLPATEAICEAICEENSL